MLTDAVPSLPPVCPSERMMLEGSRGHAERAVMEKLGLGYPCVMVSWADRTTFLTLGPYLHLTSWGC